jgi:hypothetical protein
MEVPIRTIIHFINNLHNTPYIDRLRKDEIITTDCRETLERHSLSNHLLNHSMALSPIIRT